MPEHLHFNGDGVRLHALATGRGPPVLLLHGFPESAAAWEAQLDALAPHARAVALDMRGFGGSDRPAGVDAYRLPRLVADVVAVVDALGAPPVLVGHDWGGVVAWAVAAAHPERIAHLLIVNAPHPALLAARIADPPAQAQASRYIDSLVAPDAEARLTALGLETFWDGVFGGALRRGARSAADRERAVRDWSRPGALTAMLNYYRANPIASLATVARVDAPATVLWGLDDAALLPCLLDGLDALAPVPRSSAGPAPPTGCRTKSRRKSPGMSWRDAWSWRDPDTLLRP